MKPSLAQFLAVAAIACTIGIVGSAASIPLEGPKPITHGTFTIYGENDVFFSGTDQYYTNGAKLTWLSAKKQNLSQRGKNRVSESIGKVVDQLTPAHDGYKLGVSVGQNMYTPADITIDQFQPDARPYAAWLYGSLSFHVESKPRKIPGLPKFDSQLTTVELTVGITGPDALGKAVQDWVHDGLNVGRAEGWQHQIGHQLGANLTIERNLRWRSADASDGIGWDIIPHAGISLGNVNAHMNTGLEVRYGYCLPDDFGTKLIRPGSSNSGNSRTSFRIFAFAAFDAKLVVRDLLLEGSTVSGPTQIKREPVVGDFQTGIALGFNFLQLTYSQVVRTKAFTTQPEHFDFGAAALSFFY